MEQIIIKNLSEMQRFAIQIANELRVHDNISFLLLKGGLGAGKTTFTKFLLKELGVQERVTSPTFVIMNQYVGDNDLTINHVDAYRLNNDSELEMYLDEFESSFNIIEWYENLDLNLFEAKCIKLDIQIIDENYRKVILERN